MASTVRREALDVLLMQESGPRRRLRALGEMLGWIVAADPWAFPRRRIKNAVLLRVSSRAIVRSGLIRFAGGSMLYPRGALFAEVDEEWTATSVHLGHAGPERGRHIEQLLALDHGSGGRFLIGGDLNVLPGEPGPEAIGARALDCWDAVGEGSGDTFPSHAPTARIDYLFAGPAIRPLRSWTAGGTVSDHLMVVADLDVGNRRVSIAQPGAPEPGR